MYSIYKNEKLSTETKQEKVNPWDRSIKSELMKAFDSNLDIPMII